MTAPKRWFHVYVACQSTERFDVLASSYDEARELYEKGEAHQTQDEVESRQVVGVDDTRRSN